MNKNDGYNRKNYNNHSGTPAAVVWPQFKDIYELKYGRSMSITLLSTALSENIAQMSQKIKIIQTLYLENTYQTKI